MSSLSILFIFASFFLRNHHVPPRPPPPSSDNDSWQDLIETVINTIQEPEVTDVGVSAVITSLQTYNAVMNSLLEGLPPDVPNGGDMTGASGR